MNTVAIAKIGADSSAKTTPNAPKLIINIFSEDKRSAQTGQRTQLKELSSEEFTADLDDISSEEFTKVDNSFEEEIPEDISDEPEATWPEGDMEDEAQEETFMSDYEQGKLSKGKVIREKSRGEGFLIEQDTIENVSEPNFFFNFLRNKNIYFLVSFNAKNVFTV